MCGGVTAAYFTKKIAVEYLDGLDTFEYEQYVHCEVVVSKTLYEADVFEYDCRMIDYGAGDGLLADKINGSLKKNWLKSFDAYIEPQENYLPSSEVTAAGFDFLTSSSVFEHLIGNKSDVDNVIGLVNPNGVMGLHTLICEEVLRDPEWHYLLPVPVHCTL